jgi:probable rRNA maturation factor
VKVSSEPKMLLHTIEVQIDEPFQARVPSQPLHQAALATLVHQRIEQPCELAVVVTGDEVLRELNRRHRGVDAPTDVLAFPNESRGTFVGAPGQPRYLGDIIISFHRAEAQAGELGHDVQAELQLLVVHGMLHLLGYDDVAEEQRAQIWAAQAGILQTLGVEAHLPA